MDHWRELHSWVIALLHVRFLPSHVVRPRQEIKPDELLKLKNWVTQVCWEWCVCYTEERMDQGAFHCTRTFGLLVAISGKPYLVLMTLVMHVSVYNNFHTLNWFCRDGGGTKSKLIEHENAGGVEYAVVTQKSGNPPQNSNPDSSCQVHVHASRVCDPVDMLQFTWNSLGPWSNSTWECTSDWWSICCRWKEA